MKEITQGWVILTEEKRIMDFTFSQVRTDAQHKWVRLWERPNNWKAHYNKGIRCVKAERAITLTNPNND